MHSQQFFHSGWDRGMVIERMVDGALGDERGYYDSRYAHSVLSEVKPQGVPCYLSLGNPIAGGNGAFGFHMIVKPTVFVINNHQQTRVPDRRTPDRLVDCFDQTFPAGGIIFRML